MLEQFSKGAWLTSVLLCVVVTVGPAIFAGVRTEERASLPLVALFLERNETQSLFRALPKLTPMKAENVALGRRLFGEEALSKNGDKSCSSCHDLQNGGVDGLRTHPSDDGTHLAFNTPTVFNSSLPVRLGWEGQWNSLEAHLDEVLISEKRMGTSWEAILLTLQMKGDYQHAFDVLYEDGLTKENVRDAIISFEHSLNTPDSPFDRFLSGEQEALSPSALRGFSEFLEHGCAACHQGVGLGGNLLQPRVSFSPLSVERASEAWPKLLRVPSLRNVALTAPYLHNGAVSTLAETVQLMSIWRTGRKLPEDELADMIAFLNALTGERAWERKR